ncbi:hypothetical protein JAAARDRAFT_76426 [Jaapia argillacea MUCL 33604]|uniref:Uncharacterized protein n=1 Tax=Jaapia argillacea MUCL 33604 TaxID=933084 RepID=A0A067Q951_9AGAM|nr:hypothetical protein JAAARDRAFT_76426 [Jaapia argillacea MUCL 33604]
MELRLEVTTAGNEGAAESRLAYHHCQCIGRGILRLPELLGAQWVAAVLVQRMARLFFTQTEARRDISPLALDASVGGPLSSCGGVKDHTGAKLSLRLIARLTAQQEGAGKQEEQLGHEIGYTRRLVSMFWCHDSDTTEMTVKEVRITYSVDAHISYSKFHAW